MTELFAFVLDKSLGNGSVLDQLLVNAEMSEELPEEIEREVVLPPLKNNVFGLDRDLIMSKVVLLVLNTWLIFTKNNFTFLDYS